VFREGNIDGEPTIISGQGKRRAFGLLDRPAVRRLVRRPTGAMALAAAAALICVGAAEALGSAGEPTAPPPQEPAVPPVVDAAPPEPAEPPDDTFYPEVPAVDLQSRVSRFWWDRTGDRRPLTPLRWRRRMPPECQTRGGYKEHCAGELIMPEPHGRAAAFAEHLGLGHSAAAMQLLYGAPFEEWVAAVAHLDDDTSLTFPVPEGHLGRGFGLTRRGSLRHRGHKGIDIGADEGSEIVAARDGLVVYAGKQITGYGNLVILLHRNGHSTAYAHCRALTVFAGQYVDRGEQIAEVGKTGFAYRAHLHFEWRQRGWVRDPVRKLRRRDTDPALGGDGPAAVAGGGAVTGPAPSSSGASGTSGVEKGMDAEPGADPGEQDGDAGRTPAGDPAPDTARPNDAGASSSAGEGTSSASGVDPAPGREDDDHDDDAAYGDADLGGEGAPDRTPEDPPEHPGGSTTPG